MPKPNGVAMDMATGVPMDNILCEKFPDGVIDAFDWRLDAMLEVVVRIGAGGEVGW